MIKKLCSTLLAAIMVVSMLCISAGAASTGSLNNFKKSYIYPVNQYTDVPVSNQFYENIKTGYELGIMQGYGQTFGVGDSITRLASVIIACRINCIYYTGSNTIEAGSGTQQEKYLSYAKTNNIYHDFSDFNKAATRAEFSMILKSALPVDALSVINSISDGAIPDVSMSVSYADSVYTLYKAGVLTGSDTKGSFYPSQNITRSAACAIATRMADISLRKTIKLTAAAEDNKVDMSTLKNYDTTGAQFVTGKSFTNRQNVIKTENMLWLYKEDGIRPKVGEDIFILDNKYKTFTGYVASIDQYGDCYFDILGLSGDNEYVILYNHECLKGDKPEQFSCDVSNFDKIIIQISAYWDERKTNPWIISYNPAGAMYNAYLIKK